LILKHKRDKALKPVRLKLASGSLLLMKGETQHYWKHGIEKETRPCGPRIIKEYKSYYTYLGSVTSGFRLEEGSDVGGIFLQIT
jgi:hypothetical protein